jgi:hypothetical protein
MQTVTDAKVISAVPNTGTAAKALNIVLQVVTHYLELAVGILHVIAPYVVANEINNITVVFF